MVDRYVKASITVTGIIEDEEGPFVAYCRELGTSSCGDTVEEAFDNLEDAIGVHLNGLEEVGELLKFLKERDIIITFESTEPVGQLLRPVVLDKILRYFERPFQLKAA